MRRYKQRWIVERTIGWLGNFRRLVVRYDRSLTMYRGFFHIAQHFPWVGVDRVPITLALYVRVPDKRQNEQ